MNTSASCFVMTDMGWLLVYLDSWHLRWIRSYILQVYLTNVCHIFHYYLEHWHAELHSDAWTCGYEICPHSFNLDLLCTTYFYSFECQYCFEKQLWQLIYTVICLQNPVRFVILQYFLRLICIWFFCISNLSWHTIVAFCSFFLGNSAIELALQVWAFGKECGNHLWWFPFCWCLSECSVHAIDISTIGEVPTVQRSCRQPIQDC